MGLSTCTLSLAGIPETLICVIMNCVSSSPFQVLWNGNSTDAFLPSRGLRQGDSLSPYLFVLCMERLGHFIDEATVNGSWRPLFLSRRGLALTHLFFADNLMLFSEASIDQAAVVNNILETFCHFFGQKISRAKWHIFFSLNTPTYSTEQICEQVGFCRVEDLGRYLVYHCCIPELRSIRLSLSSARLGINFQDGMRGNSQ